MPLRIRLRGMQSAFRGIVGAQNGAEVLEMQKGRFSTSAARAASQMQRALLPRNVRLANLHRQSILHAKSYGAGNAGFEGVRVGRLHFVLRPP